MKKYSALFHSFISQYFVYRSHIILWRLRQILSFLLMYYFWSAVYLRRQELFGYTQSEMITYILLIFVFSNSIFSSKTFEIAEEIIRGDIMNKLLKPISYFSYLVTRELADKTVTLAFTFVEILILSLLLKPEFSPPVNTTAVVLSLLQLVIGLGISFFISVSLSFLAFWSSNIWAPRFMYLIVASVLAGNYFPLDMLPRLLYIGIILTPFPYLMYLPARMYITGIPEEYWYHLIISMFWLVATYLIAQKMWRKGMKEYSFFGK